MIPNAAADQTRLALHSCFQSNDVSKTLSKDDSRNQDCDVAEQLEIHEEDNEQGLPAPSSIWRSQTNSVTTYSAALKRNVVSGVPPGQFALP